jgi:hypothetical protein
MFVKRNRSSRGHKRYESVLLVQGERVPIKRGPGRPRADEPRRTTVVHRTLANLSHVPPELVALVEEYCRAARTGQTVEFGARAEPVIGRAYGPLAAMLALARESGIERALGSSRAGRLALFLVLARVLHRGSRLSAIRWAGNQAVRETLGLGSFKEDDLYAALDWLCAEQSRIEKELAGARECPSVFLYDVTSSYFEGQKNELAANGYNRDGKRFKKQIVVGLLTDPDGEPFSVQVYEGNTNDQATVEDQVRKLAKEYGAHEVALVGDRGMLKTPAKDLLKEHGFRYVTALTDAEVRTRLASGLLQLELFSERVAEVVDTDGVRYVLRRHANSTKRHRARRADQLVRVQRKVDERNTRLKEHPRARPPVALEHATRWLARYHLDRFVSTRLEGRSVQLLVDEQARRKVEELDGCYVVVSNVPSAAATAERLWDRYGDLQRVERDFRTMKTSLLELRPIFLRKAGRTRGHAVMLALKVAREFERRLAPLGLTVEDALDRLDGVRLVSLADPALRLWRLPSKWDAPQRQVLDALPALPAPMLSPHRSARQT